MKGNFFLGGGNFEVRDMQLGRGHLRDGCAHHAGREGIR